MLPRRHGKKGRDHLEMAFRVSELARAFLISTSINAFRKKKTSEKLETRLRLCSFRDSSLASKNHPKKREDRSAVSIFSRSPALPIEEDARRNSKRKRRARCQFYPPSSREKGAEKETINHVIATGRWRQELLHACVARSKRRQF